uniref:Uncharacterized protein n=1 Tax=Mycena chlorophos TaxID=658473 RepID=A0ABQ0KXC7_MYCCL|nr:predicted protein [Mycena chlorophos]
MKLNTFEPPQLLAEDLTAVLNHLNAADSVLDNVLNHLQQAKRKVSLLRVNESRRVLMISSAECTALSLELSKARSVLATAVRELHGQRRVATEELGSSTASQG